GNMALNIKDVSITTREAAVEFIDLSEKPAKAKIVRQGFDVPQVALDVKKVDQFIGDLTQIPTKDLPRVGSQAIPSGTKVAKGTVVDLVLAPRSKTPFNIFQNFHADLAGKNLDSIDGLFTDVNARKTLLNYEFSGDIPTAEKNQLQTALQNAG